MIRACLEASASTDSHILHREENLIIQNDSSESELAACQQERQHADGVAVVGPNVW